MIAGAGAFICNSCILALDSAPLREPPEPSQPEDLSLRCSFCDKERAETKSLSGSDISDAQICDRCKTVAFTVLSRELAEALPSSQNPIPDSVADGISTNTDSIIRIRVQKFFKLVKGPDKS